MSELTMVAVYGTLKRGMPNHRLLAGARFIGEDLLTSIALYDLGEYPGARQESSAGVRVEIYELTAAELEELDRLEECNMQDPKAGLYSRCLCPTRYGDTWIYMYNHPIDGSPRLEGANWMPACDGSMNPPSSEED